MTPAVIAAEAILLLGNAAGAHWPQAGAVEPLSGQMTVIVLTA